MAQTHRSAGPHRAAVAGSPHRRQRGRIYPEVIRGEPKWMWFLQTEPAPPPNSGIANSLDAAKAAFKRRYAEVRTGRDLWRPPPRVISFTDALQNSQERNDIVMGMLRDQKVRARKRTRNIDRSHLRFRRPT
jgi:hypothetical protein